MSDKLRAAAQAALDWLKDKRLDTWQYMEGSQFYADRDKQVKALESALAEPEQEPVAWYHNDFGVLEFSRHERVGWSPLYAARPRREWVGLTHDERVLVTEFAMDDIDVAIRTEAKLREKNT